MKNIFYYFSISILSLSVNSYAADACDWSACKDETTKFNCTGSDEDIYKCLLKHDADLSKSCDQNAHSPCGKQNQWE